MTHTHTSGPYPLHIQHDGERSVIVTAQGNLFAATFDPSAARLIAAAPELLAALRDLEQSARKQLDQSATEDGLNNCKRLAVARAAIAKAERREA